MKRIITAVIAILSLVVLVSAKRRAVAPPAPVDLKLDASRSFAITDKAILDPFTFRRVLDAITAGSDVTSEAFFRQWWNTQNEPQCKDSGRFCPNTEGRLATEPFRPEDFIPIGIINRFDQADATQCGQYRLIYANRMVTSREAFHIIFEAEMPNPRAELGLAACRPIAQFWADLSKLESPDERRSRIERFFFDGIDGFPPAVHVDHYHRNQAGIRTLQLTLPQNFSFFYQFRVVQENGQPVVKTDTLENTAHNSLIDATNQDERAKRFRKMFVDNLDTLTIRDHNLFFIDIPSEYWIPDGRPANKEYVSALNVGFHRSLSSPEGQAFSAEIEAELKRLGSTITPVDAVARAESQNCFGCHFGRVPIGNGEEFAGTLDQLQHVSEDNATATNFVISPGMRDVFIPHRMQILKDFLISGKAPVHSN